MSTRGRRPIGGRGLAWPILVVSSILEAVWANALAASDGFSRPLPVALFLVAAVLSTAGLAYAMRRIPAGTAYAVWTGLGTVLTVAYATAIGAEDLTWLTALFLAGIVGCVAGLKRLDGATETT